MTDDTKSDDKITADAKASEVEAQNSGPDSEARLDALKNEAESLGVAYSNRIGEDALAKKIEDHKAEIAAAKAASEDAATAAPVVEEKMTLAQKKSKIRREMRISELKLVRLRVTNMNESKKDLAGEIFCVVNGFLGEVKKFIPYGEQTDNGFHVPYVLYKQLRDRKFLQVKTRNVKGQIVIDQRWVKEFALEVLDPLTPDELKKLATTQAASAGMA